MPDEVTNAHILNAITDLTGKVGGLISSTAGNESHIKSVSDKVDTVRLELQAHTSDSDAHGAGGSRLANAGWARWIGLGIAAAGLLMAIGRAVVH